jgi:hypothetical protein
VREERKRKKIKRKEDLYPTMFLRKDSGAFLNPPTHAGPPHPAQRAQKYLSCVCQWIGQRSLRAYRRASVWCGEKEKAFHRPEINRDLGQALSNLAWFSAARNGEALGVGKLHVKKVSTVRKRL